MKTSLLLTFALAPALLLAQATTPASEPAGSKHVMVKAASTEWGPGPAFLPKGIQAAVLYGDPAKAGPFALRLKAPAGGKIPRHWHPTDEQVTVIQGDFSLSMGEAGKTHDATFGPGDYVNLPAKMQHEATTKNGGIVQVNGMGPFAITYVDPKDDPRNAKPAKK